MVNGWSQDYENYLFALAEAFKLSCVKKDNQPEIFLDALASLKSILFTHSLTE